MRLQMRVLWAIGRIGEVALIASCFSAFLFFFLPLSACVSVTQSTIYTKPLAYNYRQARWPSISKYGNALQITDVRINDDRGAGSGRAGTNGFTASIGRLDTGWGFGSSNESIVARLLGRIGRGNWTETTGPSFGIKTWHVN